MPVHDDILRSRQAWFWRRVTLQSALAALIVLLGKTLLLLDYTAVSWPLCVIICAIIASVAWLITMYFAMVDNASKVASVVTAIGDAVDKVKD